jgi:hypothetical protein
MAAASPTRLFGFRENGNMQDIIYVAITIAFYIASIGYVHFCDRVK